MVVAVVAAGVRVPAAGVTGAGCVVGNADEELLDTEEAVADVGVLGPDTGSAAALAAAD